MREIKFGDIAQLIDGLAKIRDERGNLKVGVDWWCNDCRDIHCSEGVELDVENGVCVIGRAHPSYE